MKKIAAFDMLGTSFGFDNVINAIDQEFGDELRRAGNYPAQFCMMWYYTAQRDFAYLSMSGEYTPISKVFKSSLPRCLAMAFSLSLSAPSSIFDKPPKFSSSSLEAITSQLTSLPARPGLVESFNLLWDAGFEVYAITNGGVESTAKLLRSVENGGERWVDKFGAKGEDDGEKGKEWVISCDDVKKAKPAPEVYAHLLSRSKASPSSGDLIYLIAAHTWDLLSARKAGFKTAWVNYEEVVECEELFGVADVKGGGLKEVVEEIVRRSG